MRNCHHNQPSQTHIHTHACARARGQTPALRARRQPSLIRQSDSADSEHKGVCLCRSCVRRPAIFYDAVIMNELVCVHVGIRTHTNVHPCAALPRGPVSQSTESFPARWPSGRSSSGRCWPGCSLLREEDGETRQYIFFLKNDFWKF